MTDHEAYEHWLSTTTGPRFAWEAWQEATRLERERYDELFAKYHEVCVEVARLKFALPPLRARSE